MNIEVITRRDDLLIRRLTLEPGEAMNWHTDACRRFTVVVRGDALGIEYRDGETTTVPIHAGMAGWDEPDPRVHRAINVGSECYEEVVTFYLERPDVEPQPSPANDAS